MDRVLIVAEVGRGEKRVDERLVLWREEIGAV